MGLIQESVQSLSISRMYEVDAISDINSAVKFIERIRMLEDISIYNINITNIDKDTRYPTNNTYDSNISSEVLVDSIKTNAADIISMKGTYKNKDISFSIFLNNFILLIQFSKNEPIDIDSLEHRLYIM